MLNHGICMKLKSKSITVFVKCSNGMTIIQFTSLIDQKFGVLSATQRIDYFWALEKVAYV